MGQFFSQPSLAAGEISPDLYGRVDQSFIISARRLKNYIVRQYGGANNRSGSSSSLRPRTAPERAADHRLFVQRNPNLCPCAWRPDNARHQGRRRGLEASEGHHGDHTSPTPPS